MADGGDDEQVAENSEEGEAHLKQDARDNLDDELFFLDISVCFITVE